jgi:hypothetical protein
MTQNASMFDVDDGKRVMNRRELGMKHSQRYEE